MSNKIQITKEQRTKNLKMGTYSVFLTVIVIAIVVVVNLMVGQLPTTLTKFDTTNLKLYTLSDTTVDILQGLNEDVTVYYIVQHGNEDTQIEELLNRYASYSSHVKLETIDPTVRPNFSSLYTDEELTDNSVILESAKRSTVVTYEEIYTTEYTEEDYYNYYYYGTTPTGTTYFNGESALTTGIDYVTGDNLPTLYMITGHGETELSDDVLSDAKSENILTDSLSLLTVTEIPDDAGSVIINDPTSDFSEEEVQILLDYMDAGGKVILITEYDFCGEELMPNLSKLTTEYGLEAKTGLLLEGNSSNYYSYPYYLMPTLNKSADVAQNLSSTGITPMLPIAHGITEIEGESSCYIEPVLSTSDSAYIKADPANAESLDREDGDETGTFYVGVSSENTTTGGKLVWYSSPYFLDSNVYSYNEALFMSNLTTYCEKSSSISILGKALQIQSLSVSTAAATFWSAIIILVIPVGAIVTGVIVWSKRKKR